MREAETNPDHGGMALQALGWLLSDDRRAQRFLSITGLDPEGLRALAGSSALDDAVLGFLEAYQPDLIACAEAIGVEPQKLARPERGW
jgi:Protein of unknown function (DUF3572)